MSIHEIVREQFGKAVPFALHVGIDIEKIGDGTAVAALGQRAETSNHIGTQHAGALFTLGEAASGAAMAGTFAESIATVIQVATGATIDYVRLATGRIVAHATTSVSGEALRAALAETGKVQFDVQVELRDEEGAEVGKMTVGWKIRRRPARG